jgi:hypothetical protein
MSAQPFPISIGLDFGTYQTKACVRFKRSPNSPAEYHFVPFQNKAVGMDAYFFPSVLSETNDDRFVYGELLDDARFTFSFFKIASAEDEEFRLDAKLTKPKYDPERFRPYTPEFLAVVYLSHVISSIKNYVRKDLKPGHVTAPAKGFLARFRSLEVTEVNYEWTIQMGVPTEYQQRHNALRRRKFQQILLMANMLSTDPDRAVTSTGTLMHRVDDLFESLLNRFKKDSVSEVDQEEWDAMLESERLSVFPETAAGLHFLVRTNKLTKDKYYLALDIGGGSTDVSFFKVESNNTFTYLASKSVMVAANDIGIQMFGEPRKMTSLRDSIINLFRRADVSRDAGYQQAFRWVFKSINKQVYRMFNGQVYNRFEKLNATTIYKDTTCYLYGGGALMPVVNPNPELYMNQVVIHDNGVRDSFSSMQTKVEVRPIRELQINENVFPANWREKIDFLIVPLGLSLALSDEHTTRLNEDFYTKYDLVSPTGLFDVRAAKWV